jgi:hypothetical protein
MLNFAKAELLDMHPNDVTGKIRHGLSFDPTAAKTVAGDRLVVHDGVFRLLYQKRTGRNLATGTVLPVRRLLANIPEIGQQVLDAGLGSSRVGGCMHMAATDGSASWPIIMLVGTSPTSWGIATSSVFFNVFEEIDATSPSTRNVFRERFGISKRSWAPVNVYQSRSTTSNAILTEPNMIDVLGITWGIKDFIGLRTEESIDASLAPSLYKQKTLIMPPSLCRYAITFYASSLVRYRPYMFDSERYPEQAYMFDAIARECALPMLIDTFSGLENCVNLFNAPNTWRL